MLRRIACLGFLLLLLAPSVRGQSTAPSATTALVGPTVLNPADSTVIEDATIVMNGPTITALGPSDEINVPSEATVRALPDKYVIPGLIDGHVHFFQSGGLYTRPDILDLRSKRPYSTELRRIKQRLPDTFRRYLRSGVTGVVDVGGPMWNLQVRARADTTAMAPSVVTAGPLISSVSRPRLDTGDPPILKITSPQAARAEVQEQVEAGVDLIKIWYITTGGSPADYRPVVEATVDEAHAANKRVAVHATELETARAAIEAGADILVHSVFNKPVDDTFVQLLQENDVLYIPTLMVQERYRETFAQQLDLTLPEHRIGQKDVIRSLTELRTLPDSLVPRGLRQRIASAPSLPADTTALRNLKRLHDAGVAIAAGTDAGNIGTPHGPALFREFALMQAAGLTPREILTTATAGGARLMDRSDDLGQLEAGRQADLVVLNKNPLNDITHTRSIHRVVKRGRIFAPDSLVPRTPEEVVLQAHNAYNTHDATAFLDAFAPNLKVYEHPNTLVTTGLDTIAAQYRPLLENATTLHSQFHYHTTVGNTVMAHESIYGLPDRDRPLSQVFLYQVTNGAIDRAWILQK
ncbi:amidohydrolase [Salinibacter sp. 10B]|uniref:amidohydrolase family protein n=1 Tax=Salinibacter sp. 10B TaxID=1923971 RepID=UPI000CF4B569|nr:amidohydrolase family protein [Salinibacter sp. 10B]PQJ34380.1 amidohydrolase [Salinibacter sp. 10B]